VVELVLQIKALRNALGRPQSKTQIQQRHRPSGHR
jgi:hypothetical protein